MARTIGKGKTILEGKTASLIYSTKQFRSLAVDISAEGLESHAIVMRPSRTLDLRSRSIPRIEERGRVEPFLNPTIR